MGGMGGKESDESSQVIICPFLNTSSVSKFRFFIERMCLVNVEFTHGDFLCVVSKTPDFNKIFMF